MPSKHAGHPTIAFRPSTPMEYALINERASLSGMHKKDFIVRSCIYGHICVVGTKENVKKIVDAVQEMQQVMKEIAGQLETGDFFMSNEAFEYFKNDLLALSITVVDILNGADYLFDKKATSTTEHWKKDLRLSQLQDCINKDVT